MPKRTRDHHSWLISQLTDPVVAARYVNEALSESPDTFLKALRNVAEAKKISVVAEGAGVNRESLYKSLSENGNPRLNTLTSVMGVLGLKLSVEPTLIAHESNLQTAAAAPPLPRVAAGNVIAIDEGRRVRDALGGAREFTMDWEQRHAATISGPQDRTPAAKRREFPMIGSRQQEGVYANIGNSPR